MLDEELTMDYHLCTVLLDLARKIENRQRQYNPSFVVEQVYHEGEEYQSHLVVPMGLHMEVRY